MKFYEEPSIEVVVFETEDIMDESPIVNEGGNENESPFA